MIIDKLLSYTLSHTDFNPRVIFDVGSRDLGQSIEFNSVYPNAEIYAFEPNPAQYDICVQNAIPYNNIHVTQKAVSDVNGVVDFFVTHGNVGASSMLLPIDVPFGTTNDFTKISVQSVRLDEWMLENNVGVVDILWMDAQGIELKALRSMGEHLKQVKFLHCEAAERPYYEGHLLKPELDEFLVSMGFDLIFNNEAYHPYNEGDIIAINRNI